MKTSLSEVFDAFLARIHADDWMNETDIELAERDWTEFLKMAIFRVKYPRVDLTIDISTGAFASVLTQSEIQLLAIFMKHEWIKRCIATWEKIKSYYSDRDFSEANHLDKLNDLERSVALEAHKAYGIYDRARNGKPEIFSKLAGKKR